MDAGIEVCQEMSRRRFRLSAGAIFVVLTLLSVFFFILPTAYTTRVNYLFVRVTSPVLNLFGKSLRPREDTVSRDEYKKVFNAYAKTNAQLLRLQSDYAKLAGIRQSLPDASGRIVMAKIVRTSIVGVRSELVIDKGSADHVRAGQYVVSSARCSVIGTVSDVIGRMARVRLVTDPTHHIGANILRHGDEDYIPCQLWGKSNNLARIPLLTQKEYDISAGDIVYASQRAGFLGLDLVIGTITEVRPDDAKPLLWDISVRPIHDFSRLKDVGIVIGDPAGNGLE
jgi:cell shape-determining protein MreC